MPKAFADKLDAFDARAERAVDELLAWLAGEREALVILARGRLVEGHYRYGDRLMYELSIDELRAEGAEELADAIAYMARELELREAD